MFGFGPPLSSLILSHIYNVLLVSKASWGSKETFSRTWVGVQFKAAFNLGTEFFLCRIQTGWVANNLRILWQLNEWFSSGGSALDCVVCGLCIVITHNECGAAVSMVLAIGLQFVLQWVLNAFILQQCHLNTILTSVIHYHGNNSQF